MLIVATKRDWIFSFGFTREGRGIFYLIIRGKKSRSYSCARREPYYHTAWNNPSLSFLFWGISLADVPLSPFPGTSSEREREGKRGLNSLFPVSSFPSNCIRLHRAVISCSRLSLHVFRARHSQYIRPRVPSPMKFWLPSIRNELICGN